MNLDFDLSFKFTFFLFDEDLSRKANWSCCYGYHQDKQKRKLNAHLNIILY